MAPRTKDLFDDSVMTFGEHLESLRSHLIKALIGVAIAMIFSLYYGDVIVGIIRQPLDNALQRYGRDFGFDEQEQQLREGRESLFREFSRIIGLEWFFYSDEPEETSQNPAPAQVSTEKHDAETKQPSDELTVEVSSTELMSELHRVDAERFPTQIAEQNNTPVRLNLKSPLFRELRGVIRMSQRPVTLNVQEGFMVYLKLSGFGGLMLASPWVFYQVWMFVAAGLYPHERKYVYLYGGMSLGLFAIGAIFCYYLVFPFVLRFLIGFNVQLGLTLQPRLSEWITFAIVLPMMFGISFQLPLIMLFLERLQIVNASLFIEQRRMAILIIAILSMVLTPADPVSMLLMMFPLIGLYEVGIMMCRYSPSREPAAENET